MRYLKKMMGVRQATSNAFMYLELGVLPIKYEIHKRQLLFLYHIVNLPEDDPVKKVWRNQTNLPDYGNWWCDVKVLMEIYGIEFDEETLMQMSKDTFKKKVKKAVAESAFEELKRQNEMKSRTKGIRYEKFEVQNYVKKMDPWEAKLIFKCRSKTLSIKDHMQFKYNENSCRWCGIGEETLSHIVNCGNEECIDAETILTNMEVTDLKVLAKRIQDFLSKVEL